MINNISQTNVLCSEVIAKLRNKNTEPPVFRHNLRELGIYLAYEASKYLSKKDTVVKTPLGNKKMKVIADDISVISILRAAAPMAEGVLSQYKHASVGFVSASRGKMLNEQGTDFRIDGDYFNVPYLENKVAILVDPMLASGSTLLYLVDKLYHQNPTKIIILCAIASNYGLKRLKGKYDELIILAGDIDPVLDKKGYIVPGLGDAGDRAFNTE